MNHSSLGLGANLIFEQTLRHQIKNGEATLLAPGGECNLRIKNMRYHKIYHTFVMEGRDLWDLIMPGMDYISRILSFLSL